MRLKQSLPLNPLKHIVRLRRIGYVVLLGLVLLYGAPLWAQLESKEIELGPLAKELDRIERALERVPLTPAGGYDEYALVEWLKLVRSIKDVGRQCVPTGERALEKINKDLVSLGVPAAEEPAEVTKKREALNKEKTEQENRLNRCRVLLLRIERMRPQIIKLQEQLLAQRLFARGPTFFALLKDERLRPAAWVSESRSFVQQHSVLRRLSAPALSILALVLVVALAIGGLLRHQLHDWTLRHRWHKNLSSYLGQSVVTAFAHYAPHLLFSLAAAVFFFVATRQMDPIPFGRLIAYGLPPYFLAATTIHLFLSPFAPAEPFLPVPKNIGTALATRLKVFLLLVFLGYLLFATLLAQRLPEPALLLARSVFAVVFFVNLTWALWLLGRIPGLAKTLWLRAGLLLVLLTALLAELLGYRNLSVWGLRDVVGSLIALGVLMLARRLFRELFDGLDKGHHSWHRRLRQTLALKAGDHFPGLVSMRVITATFLWAAFALALLRIWGLPQATFQRLYSYVADGFTVGSLHVNPARIVLAVVVMTFLLAFSGWIRSRLKRRWIGKTRMERGAREATFKIAGYVGVVIAIVVALAVAGFEFTNLAIIAGALSVGIGFGLQTIVNNFVSGLILLFERPIKTGDWVVVGSTAGYVKHIGMRSTQIQTFDRADVIVPNSDLISNQVTNWMLYEARGRVKVSVGVAYGSDTEKVRDLLLGVVRQHPRVITDGSAPEPNVLFLGFGDSSLDFELRCHIDEIDYRLQVVSDLNFAIDKAFRKHGVEIPFPQRDIHVRNWPAPQKGLPVSQKSRSRKRPSRSSVRGIKTDNPGPPDANE